MLGLRSVVKLRRLVGVILIKILYISIFNMKLTLHKIVKGTRKPVYKMKLRRKLIENFEAKPFFDHVHYIEFSRANWEGKNRVLSPPCVSIRKMLKFSDLAVHQRSRS